MKSIIITGSTGFIGRATVSALLAAGFQVTPIGRYIVSDKITADSVLLALAGRMPLPKSNSQEIIKQVESNISYHIKLLAQIHQQVRRVVYVSSIDVYGPPQDEFYDENHSTSPASLYGLTKLCAEKLLSHYCQAQDIPLMILRPSQVYGPGDNLDKVIPRFIAGIKKREPITFYGAGDDVRTYLYVVDLVQALVLAVKSDITGIFNVSGNEPITIKELISLIETACGASAQIIKKSSQDPANQQKVSSYKLQIALNWRPEVSLQQGLRLTTESFKA